MEQPRIKELRRAYGFDEVAIVPGDVTINPEQTNIDLQIGHFTFHTPIIASAMDAVVSPAFAVMIGKMGGLGVLNLEGVWTRYDNPKDVLQSVIECPADKVTPLLQKIYTAPLKDNLIGERIQEIKREGVVCAVSVTPPNTKKFAPLVNEAKADILVVQSTVTTARHKSKSYRGLHFDELVRQGKMAVIVGNCVGFGAALELIETGIDGLLVGVGPGAACTTREVLGIGVPQVTATLDCSAARDYYHRRTGKYVVIITDGGIRTGGDLCKSFACGADAVMIGTPFAQTTEAPGKGFNWGMASPHPALPRCTRIKVGIRGCLQQVLFGPSTVTDGTQNLAGALRLAMGSCGAGKIRDFHKAELVVAPAMKTEGKVFQLAHSI